MAEIVNFHHAKGGANGNESERGYLSNLNLEHSQFRIRIIGVKLPIVLDTRVPCRINMSKRTRSIKHDRVAIPAWTTGPGQ